MRRLVNVIGQGGTPVVPTLAGDVTGPATGNTISSIQGNPVNAPTPLGGDALVWSGSQWIAQTVVSTIYPQLVYFTLNGQPSTFQLNVPLDGQRQCSNWDVTGAQCRQRVAASVSGAGCQATLYKRSGVVRVALYNFTLTSANGSNGLGTSTAVGSPGDYTCTLSDCLELDLTAATSVSGTLQEDVTFSIYVTPY